MFKMLIKKLIKNVFVYWFLLLIRKIGISVIWLFALPYMKCDVKDSAFLRIDQTF